MIQCKNPSHGKSIPKRWLDDDGKWYAIQRCRKCDVWERIEIEALDTLKQPTIKRTKIIEQSNRADETNSVETGETDSVKLSGEVDAITRTGETDAIKLTGETDAITRTGETDSVRPSRSTNSASTKNSPIV